MTFEANKNCNMPCLGITVAQVLGAAMFMINIGGAFLGSRRHEMAWKLM